MSYVKGFLPAVSHPTIFFISLTGLVANSKAPVSVHYLVDAFNFTLLVNETMLIGVFLRLIKVNVDQLKKRAERFGMNVSSVSQKVTVSLCL